MTSFIVRTHDVYLGPPNLAALGVSRQQILSKDSNDGRAADLVTIMRTPYPVLKNYKAWCKTAGLNPFAGGDYLDQGPANVPGYITSGYRDEIIGGNKTSPHPLALALDVAVGGPAKQLAAASTALQYFTRIGLYPHRGFIHVDLVPKMWVQKHHKAFFWLQRKNGTYVTFNSFTDMVQFVKMNHGVIELET